MSFVLKYGIWWDFQVFPELIEDQMIRQLIDFVCLDNTGEWVNIFMTNQFEYHTASVSEFKYFILGMTCIFPCVFVSYYWLNIFTSVMNWSI